MPSIAASNPALQIKGYNPYVKVVLNQGGMAPISQPVQTQTANEGSSFQAFGADQYQPGSGTTTSIQAHNLSYRVLEHLNIKVPYAQLDLMDRTPEDAMYLEGLDFNMHLKSGQVKVNDVGVTLTIESLLKQQDLPLEDVRVTFDPHNQVNLEAKVKALGFLSLPVKVAGTVGATPGGELTYAMGKVSVMGLPVNGLMKTFGLSIEKTLKLNDPAKGYYAVGNTVHINPNHVLAQPGINVHLSDVSTHVGDLVLTFGDTPADVQHTKDMLARKDLNALEIKGGHFYYDGYFVKDGVVRMEDKTPDTPLEMEKDGETIMNLSKGFVGVTNYRFSSMISGKLGEDSSLKYPTTRLKSNAAELQGLMWNTIPLKLDLAFDRTDKGQLMFTPGNAKAFGFIPLPDSLIRKQVNGMVDGGVPYGNGVSLPTLGDTHLGYLTSVSHQPGYLILEAGTPPQNPYQSAFQNVSQN